MKKGIVFDIRRYSIQDGPGIRTTVFFKGCPLRCLWCHNPESQGFTPELMIQPEICIGCRRCYAACPLGLGEKGPCIQCGACAAVCPAQGRMMAGRARTVEEVMCEVRRDVLFYDQSGGGITVSGGEPLSQPEFLLDLLQRCGQERIHRALDTSGYATWEILEPIAAEVDLFLFDLKHMDAEMHQKYTGVDNRPILNNLVRLLQQGCRGIIRMPLIPGINNDERNLRAMGVFLRERGCSWPVNLLPYHKMQQSKYLKLQREYLLPEIEPPTEQQMEDALRLLQSYGLQVSKV